MTAGNDQTSTGTGTRSRTGDRWPPERLLIGVSGSVAALNLPTYLYASRAAGVAHLAVVLTPAAEAFLPVPALRHIVDGVYTEHEQGRGHVALARWAHHLVVLPATANLLGCVANGLAPNLLTTVLLAAECPVAFVPAMNLAMWRKPAVQRNVTTLRRDGHQVIEPLLDRTYEVASRAIVPGLVVPPPDALLRSLALRADRADGAERAAAESAERPAEVAV